MLKWKFALVRWRTPNGDSGVALHEAHYEGSDLVYLAVNPVRFSGESVDGIKRALRAALEACDGPIIEPTNYQ